uniref:Lin1244/Lin1753 domain-containing protein n=1 Tax=uncultured Dysgonomonas sp. TaxID=206096 RepID=UPI0025859B6B|nr:Lin1244/Lin1753 domain-containing protein [uncultured Dysgonomonas sp.]
MKHIKDAYYFPHDCNAKDDPKCLLLIDQLGLEGYGAFWILVETLREQSDLKYPLKSIPALARRYNTTAEKMKTVILSFDLFVIVDDLFFFSDSLNRRMQIYLDKKKALSEAGKKGNQIRWNKEITKQSGSDQVAITNKTNENKTNKNLFTKEIDVENIKVPDDGTNRNLEGLIRRLRELNITLDLYEKVIHSANYGEIGHPVWKVLDTIRDRKNGKNSINDPSAYIKKCLEL